jgi:excinuclease ABC subunit A
VVFAGKRVPEAVRCSLDGARAWLEAVERDPGGLGVAPRALEVSAGVRHGLAHKLGTLVDAGLGYLPIEREAASLSGGELQRLRLASSLGDGLVGVTYVLDEPTQGLHRRDVERLARVLRDLADAGNAVVVVEHDAALVARADQIVELGPGSGPSGGSVTAVGPPASLPPASYTARLLSGDRGARGRARRACEPGVTLHAARLHNLRDLTVSFPVSALVAVTGVSGSGKSTLVNEVLGPSITARLAGRDPVACDDATVQARLAGVESLRGDTFATGRSTVATLIGVSDALRSRFASTAAAKARGLTARSFSTSSAGGRCAACEGRGVLTIPMDLLPDVVVECETCGGRRFVPQVLECTLHGVDIAQALDASLREVAARFASDDAIHGPIRTLAELGLGYLRLGQDASTLSAGERQRVRLAMLLARPQAEPVAVLLDEPTRGLGFDDVSTLVGALGRLADAGHMVVVVEHDLDLIAAADWIIDLGPEGGDGGGRIVVEGPPELVRRTSGSHTGRALAEHVRLGGTAP